MIAEAFAWSKTVAEQQVSLKYCGRLATLRQPGLQISYLCFNSGELILKLRYPGFVSLNHVVRHVGWLCRLKQGTHRLQLGSNRCYGDVRQDIR
jgi:hypothetical protein